MKKIWVISDTHFNHLKLNIPKDCDAVIHCGDSCSSRYSFKNNLELICFLDWFKNLPMENKIYVPGNHDISLERNRELWKSDFENLGITLLDHDATSLYGLDIFGSPYTTTFGVGWSFNVSRGKINRYWDQIPENTDILITHGPPKGILDLSKNRDGSLGQNGDSNLFKRVSQIRPKFHLFGHFHNDKGINNFGIRKFGYTTFVNSACTIHNSSEILNGNIIEI